MRVGFSFLRLSDVAYNQGNYGCPSNFTSIAYMQLLLATGLPGTSKSPSELKAEVDPEIALKFTLEITLIAADVYWAHKWDT